MAVGDMSPEEREAFLAGVHVGVLAVEQPGRGPHALPIWYQYLGGNVVMRVDDASVKARLVRAAGRATLTVQSEEVPYKYVSVEGPAVVDDRSFDDLALATRYLGDELGKWYADNNPPGGTGVVITLTPEHWRTYDFGKLFG
jgi:hypothetical protein